MTKTFVRLAACVAVCALASAQSLYVSSLGTTQVLQYNGVTGAFTGVFATGGGLAGAYGITFGPDGNLYVASAFTDQILRYNGDTGDFVDVFASGGGLGGPYGITFGPDGNLYVASVFTDQVLRFNGATGAFIDVFASGGGLSRPYGITFGPDGNLYVASGGTEQVLRYNGATGAFMGVFASGGGLDGLLGITFGPDGNLYVVSYNTNQVLRYNGATGAFIDVFASGGGLWAPVGITFGPDGNLYVASAGTGQVLRYDGATGAFINVFASGGGLSIPTFLVFRAAPIETAADAAFQVRYVANLNVVDSLINITNTGMNGAMPFGPGIGAQAGNICVNVYAFSPDEQMVGCCSCHITPNGLISLSVYNDIRAITLTGLTPNSMVVKLVATATGAGSAYSGGTSACSQSSAGINVTHPLAPGGMAAWATTGHVPGAFPVPGAPAPFAITETRFTSATLSAGEIASLNNRCTAIIGNGSTFGTCRSCSVGGRGSAKQ